jgi:hypothetical protein
MADIEVDGRLAEAKGSQARLIGLSVANYLELFVPPDSGLAPLSNEESERMFNELVFSGPTLLPDFSPADIYDFHD